MRTCPVQHTLQRVLEDSDDALKLFRGEVTSALAEIDIGLLADQVGVAATDTLDLGQGVHDLLLAIDVGVEQTDDVLEAVDVSAMFARSVVVATVHCHSHSKQPPTAHTLPYSCKHAAGVILRASLRLDHLGCDDLSARSRPQLSQHAFRTVGARVGLGGTGLDVYSLRRAGIAMRREGGFGCDSAVRT